jgi:alkylhydroperoxidase family enzyme
LLTDLEFARHTIGTLFIKREAFMSSPTYVDRQKLEFSNWPEFTEAYFKLAELAFSGGALPRQIKHEVFTVSSQASGCLHCQAHGSYGLHRLGVPLERIQALWEFETSSLFSEEECAVLRFARDSGVVPNAVGPEHYEELRQHLNDRQVTELLAVISIGAFFNRYNDTLAAVTDNEAASWALENLTPVGWSLGKHRGAKEEQRPDDLWRDAALTGAED